MKRYSVTFTHNGQNGWHFTRQSDEASARDKIRRAYSKQKVVILDVSTRKRG